MILPIVVYGHPALKAENREVASNHPELQKLIDDMFETMRNADGVGLAAPQINQNIRLFVVDLSAYELPEDQGGNFKRAFINPVIVEREGEPEYFNEGCLSVPDIHEDVLRPPRIRIKYFDRDWNLKDEWLEGIPARVCQHEYDHIEGILFVDHLANLKRMMLRRKLTDMSKGIVNAHYRTVSPKK